MFLEGHIIEFLDAEQLRMGYVRKQERDRLHVVDVRGRNLSASRDRVVIIHRAASESDFAAVARQISEDVVVRQRDVDVELLWQSLAEKPREIEAGELAKIFFGESSAEAASAIFRSLLEDTLYFKRKGSQFSPKTKEQVAAEQTRRQRQHEREEFRERTMGLIRQLLTNKSAPATAETESILDRIQNWLKYKTGDEAAAILEEMVGPARVREAAYEMLLGAKRIDPSADRFLVMAGVDLEFPGPLLQAADRLAPYVCRPNRVDYQDIPAFTIDDEDTREVDDALTVTRSGSKIVVGIHIADVSAFVEKDDLLDAEASRRCSSIYLPTLTVRMFPERLSTDLASLTAGVPRPAFTVEVEFDEQGHRLGYRIALGTIRVQRRLSYDEADKMIEAGDPGLHALYGIAKHLHGLRAERGAITFRRPELKIRVHGDEIHIKKLNPNTPSRLLVSEMMILGNGLAADFASVNSIPVIYRTQEPREALAVDEGPAIEALAFERIRKTFKRSRLSLTPSSHSGLGLSAYTQTSSPIRRYADLVTQRQFTASLSAAPAPHVREELLQILVTAEAAEQEIRAIEDRSTTYWLLEYLSRSKKNQPLSAVALDAKGNLELEDYYLRGKIASPTKVRPGDTFEVQIESIDPAKGEVRFRLA